MNVILSNLMHVLLVLLLLLLIGSLWNPSDWSHNSISPSILPSFLHMLTDNRPNSLNFLYFMNNSCHVLIGSFVILPIVWVLTFKKLKHLQHVTIKQPCFQTKYKWIYSRPRKVQKGCPKSIGICKMIGSI